MTFVALLWVAMAGSPVALDEFGGLSGTSLDERALDTRALSRPVLILSQDAEDEQDPVPSDDRIEKLRRDLAQPGPEAKSVRENAINSLLLMPEREAHEVLCGALAQRTEDPDGVRAFVLSTLASKWRISADPVFGAEAAGRADLIRLYVASMVRAFDGGPATAGAVGASAEQQLVWDCLRSLSLLDQQRVFQTLVVAPDESQRRASMWAMAGCRNLGLAPLLASALDASASVADTARKALAMLTFVEEPFRNREQFDAWYAEQRSIDYTTLAERAGRRALESQSRRVVELEKQLIAALVRADAVDWEQLRSLLERASDGDTMRVYLRELHDGLQRRTSLGGSVEARGRLVEWLLEGLDADLSTEEFGARLGVLARLVARTDPDDRNYTSVVARLAESVRDPRPSVRIAALRGLQRHFSAESRRIVVEVGTEALRVGDFALLAAALECLSTGSWVAPAPPAEDGAERSAELEAWLALQRSVLRGTDRDITVALRELAVQVLIQPTEAGPRLASAYDLLLEVAGTPDPEVSIGVRKVALGRLRVFDEEGRGGAYVDALLGLLDDPSAELRESAAKLLGGVASRNGGAGPDAARVIEVVSRLGDRLLEEVEESPYRAVFESLMQMAAGPVEATNVIGRFCQGAQNFVDLEPSAQKPFQREMLVKGLQRLGAVQRQPLEQWTTIGESLGRLEDRKALRFVLERQRVASLAGSEDPLAVRAWQLVVRAASMGPPDGTWSEAEAAEIVLAYTQLDELGSPLNGPQDRARRVRALAMLGRHAEVLARGKAALEEQLHPLVGESRNHVLLAVAAAHIAGGDLAAAEATLDEAEGAESGRSLVLRTALARAHLENREFEVAVRILERVMQGTATTSQAYPERFLLDCEARFRANPDGERAKVLQELRDQAALFEAESTPAAQRARFTELETELSEGRSGG